MAKGKKHSKPIIPHRNTQLIAAEYMHEGPLPAPAEFAGYGEVLPDAPERILAMAEKEQEHRHQMENDQISILKSRQDAENKESMIGLIAGIIFVGVFFLFGCYLIIIGKPVSGWVSVGASVLFVVKAMIDRDKRNKNQK